ncbi:MAG: hypothetical protein C0513_03810 [Isosphaera sp.]|nr:hypothetical protein [Isosphaera sp.]
MNSISMIAAGIAALTAGAVAQGQSFTTVFGPNGTVGAAVPDAAVLNGLGAFTTFGGINSSGGGAAFAGTANAGETLFFQVGPLYVGGAGPAASNPLSAQGLTNLGGVVSNNHAYGVIGQGRSDITFTSGVVDNVILQVRGTTAGQITGTNPINSFGGIATELTDAQGTLLVWTELGLEATLQVSNADFQIFTLNAIDFLGDSITRISLVNQGPSNSAIVLGELTVGLVPTPGAAGLLALGGLAAARRRR